MKLITRVMLAMVITIAPKVVAQRGGGGPSATCRGADAITAIYVTAYQKVVTSTDTGIVAFRERQKSQQSRKVRLPT